MLNVDWLRSHCLGVNYRAMLCVSAVFAVDRCLSVCPSSLCIVSRWLKMSSNFFLDPVAPSFEFLKSSAGTQFQGKPLQRGAQNTQVGKFAIFDWNHTLSIEWYHFQWPWLTLDRDCKVAIFFNIEFIRKGMTYSYSYYRTSKSPNIVPFHMLGMVSY